MIRLFLMLPILLLNTMASGDGGVVRASEDHGEWTITVFSSPTPFRVGPVDLSVLVQDRTTGETVLDAEVSLMLRHETSDSILVAATREASTNRLLSAALFDLPESGTWSLDVLVSRGEHEARLHLPLETAPPLPRLVTLWTWLAFPAIVLLIFTLHQWLVRTRRTGRMIASELTMP